MLVDPAVQRAVREYHPDMVVRYNPEWWRFHGGNRFLFCLPAPELRLVDERIGLYQEVEKEVAVLGVDQASYVDYRWFPFLEEGRRGNQRDPKYVLEAESQQRLKSMRERTYDWAKDEGFWHLKKQYGYDNFANVQRPGRVRKFLENRERAGMERGL